MRSSLLLTKKALKARLSKKAHGLKSRVSTLLLCSFIVQTGTLIGLDAKAAVNNDKTSPSGTLLLPMTPKLDSGNGNDTVTTSAKQNPAPNPVQSSVPKPASIAATPQKQSPEPSNNTKSNNKPSKKNKSAQTKGKLASKQGPEKNSIPDEPESVLLKSPTVPGVGRIAGTPNDDSMQLPPKKPVDPDIGNLDEISDGSLLKGTVQIVADDTEYDQSKNTFLGTGNAVATIGGQDSRLEADMILYDQNSQTMDARGNVKIIRQGEISTGSAFKFKVTSDEYMITRPDTEVSGTQVIARVGMGSKSGMSFKDGTLTMPNPIHFAQNPYFGTLQSSEDTMYKNTHPDAYVPEKPNYIFKARKMVYERYKDQGNVTIFGGRVCFGKFSIPLGKFVASIGTESRVVFPIAPAITNNLQMGGLNVGPKFSYGVGKRGVFYWMPMVQIGGRQTNGTNDKGRYGASAQVGYIGPRLTAQAAYGSNSNLLVGNLRYTISDFTHLQGGINKFLPDGLFGARRARSIMEVVDNRYMGGIPLLTGINFRTSAGWMSDQPSLLNLTPQYKELFTVTNGNTTSGYRVQEQLIANSLPIFALGDKKYGVNMNVFGGVAGKAYSTGDSLLMGQIGPILNVNLARARIQGMVTKSSVRGQSPFVFDQFIQGTKSASLAADVKLCKWLTVGTNVAYNLQAKMLYQRSFSCAVGPEDFKVLLSRDTIRGINRFGFDVLYGAPIPFNKLVLKGSPDHGQLGGI